MSTLPMGTDVLVVGAGPTGLTLATALTRLGHHVVVIDRGSEIRDQTRAAAVQPRAVEDLARLGVEDALLERGVRSPGFRFSDTRGPLFEIPYDKLDTPYPFALLVPQQQTEAVLLEALEKAGGEVWRDHRLVGLAEEFDDVAATVADSDAVVRSVRARYVVGCDGAHSEVRSRVGIGFSGESREQAYALADVRVATPAESLVVESMFAPDGLVVREQLPDGVVRIVGTIPPDVTSVTGADIQAMLDRRWPAADRPTVTEVLRANPYWATARVADSFRAGRVLLAGDAAHVHSPAGGQGMNTGIQDAVNLSWRLASVLDGEPAGVLDDFARERRSVASGVVRFTSQLAEMAELSDPESIQLRDGVLRAVGQVPGVGMFVATRLAQLDIAYASAPGDHPLVGHRIRPDGEWASHLAWATVPHRYDGRDVIVTVRPDGYAAAVSDPGPDGDAVQAAATTQVAGR